MWVPRIDSFWRECSSPVATFCSDLPQEQFKSLSFPATSREFSASGDSPFEPLEFT